MDSLPSLTKRVASTQCNTDSLPAHAALVSVVLGANVSATSAANTVIATLPVSGVLQISADPTRGLVFVGNSVG